MFLYFLSKVLVEFLFEKCKKVTRLLTALPLTPLGNIQPKTQGTPSPQKRVAPPTPSEAAEVEGSGRFPAGKSRAVRRSFGRGKRSLQVQEATRDGGDEESCELEPPRAGGAVQRKAGEIDGAQRHSAGQRGRQWIETDMSGNYAFVVGG